jgi:hypothetical protein
MTLRSLATFEASFPVDPEYDHPEGCYLARRLEQGLRALGLAVEEFDNWRDCGWCVPCTIEGTRLWVCFARYGEDKSWQLFVEPLGLPGPISRLLGKRRPPCQTAVRRLALEVDRMLSNEPFVSAIRWALNADPRSGGVPNAAALSWPTDAGA